MSNSIPRDVQEFIAGYPTAGDNPHINDNLRFYRGELKVRMGGRRYSIDSFHEAWQGDYDSLESAHDFIQWIFLIREHGMNWDAKPLQPHERDAMRADPAVIARVITSYELMLDFYGIQLLDRETGLLSRSVPPRNYAARYTNLRRHPHNFLRISRILKHLSEMGLEHLNGGFILHLLNEQSEHNTLADAYLIGSMDRWWANCIRNQEERRAIREAITKVRSGQMTFTREMYEGALKHRKEARTLSIATEQSEEPITAIES